MPDFFKEGMKTYHEGRFVDAINLFHKELEINENNSKAWNSLGICLSKTKNYEDAATCFYNALSLNPDNTIYKKNFHKLEKFFHDSDDILLDDNTIPPNRQSDFGKNTNQKNKIFSFALVSDLVLAFGSIVVALLLMSGAWVFVTTSVENSITGKQTEVLISDGAYSAAQKGEKLYNEGRYSEALVKFQYALTQEPNSYSILNDIGRCYSKLGRDLIM